MARVSIESLDGVLVPKRIDVTDVRHIDPGVSQPSRIAAIASSLVMTIGQAKRIRRRAMPGHLAINRRSPRLACSSSSEDEHPTPSPSTKPSRSRSNGRLAVA